MVRIILIVLFCALLGAAGQVLFKLGSEELSFSIELLKNWQLILGLACYGIATILFVVCLKHGNLSLLYPLIATSYIWVAIFSKILLGEAIPLTRWIGVGVILLGVAMVAR